MSIDADAYIGRMDWYACDECQHYTPDTGGCDVDGWNNCEVDGDFVVCNSFEYINEIDEEVIEVNPNQLNLDIP